MVCCYFGFCLVYESGVRVFVFGVGSEYRIVIWEIVYGEFWCWVDMVVDWFVSYVNFE